MANEELSRYFREYYKKNKLGIPDMLFQREIGYIPFNGTMIRHIKFNSNNDVKKFMNRAVPRHLYYSSAYYRFPDQHKMIEKEWLGAELVFDLDADHIEGAKNMTYMEILEQVKKHTRRLLNILMNDFGFNEKEIRLYFSGGRGYHVHVESDSIYTMASDARREIGDYIRVEGLNIDELRVLDDSFFSYGLLKKLNEYISYFYSNIDDKYIHDIFGRNAGNYLKHIEKFYNGEKIRDFMIRETGNKFRILNQRDRNDNSSIDYDRLILSKLLEDFKKSELAEIDEPVTTDIHRLIRFPMSLHGKTGLCVKPVNPDYLKDFQPLNQAIPEIFKNREATIELTIKKFQITMNNQEYILETGIHKIPLYLAIFIAAINVGKFIN
ncbi:MAG: DNA primase catalytic subunit PriS [Ferroplasma sp.]